MLVFFSLNIFFSFSQRNQRSLNKNDFYSTPINHKHMKLETSLQDEAENSFIYQQHHISSSTASPTQQSNESFLSAKSSLKASSSTASSSQANNSSKHVKFLIDYTSSATGSTTRSTSADDYNRMLLYPSPVTATSNDNSGSNSNYNETPIQFSRTSSLQSLNSCSVKNSPILSSLQSEYSASRQESGAQSPFLNEQTSFLTTDSNPKSNEITVIEKTMLHQTMSDRNEITISYGVENSPWQCNSSRNSDISSLSIIREDNDKLLTPINADLDAIYKLLNNKKNPPLPKLVLFTPPVKLASNCDQNDGPLSPAYSELSIPSIIKEDLKSEIKVDFGLLNSRLFPPKQQVDENIEASNPSSNTPVGCTNVSANESEDESEENEIEGDDNKILLDFVNKMLPNLTKKEKLVEDEKRMKSKGKCQSRIKNTPIVNMTKTAQLRMTKMQKLKSENSNKIKDENNKFKVPTTPSAKNSSKMNKNTLKRI